MKPPVIQPCLSGASDAARIACLMALIAMTMGACAGLDEVDDRAIRTDSAGVTIVHYPSLPSLEESRIALSPEPDLIIGREGAEPAYEFFRIRGVARLADGSLVVADRGSVQLRFFNSEGRFLRSSGREGEGPGEFRSMGGMWVMGGDSLVVWNAQRSYSVFSPEGEFVRTAHFTGSPFTGFRQQYFPKGVLSDGRVLLLLPGLWGEGWPTTPQRYSELLAFRALDDEQWDSLRVTKGPEMFFEPDPTNPNAAFPRVTTFSTAHFSSATGSTVAVVVDAAEFHIELYESNGRLFSIVSAALPDVPVTTAMVEAFIEERSEADRERIRNAPRASVLPKIQEVFVDSEDRIWVERFAEPQSHTSRWEVFERDGTWIGRIEMPNGFARVSGFYVNSEQVTGVWVDPETGVETVRVYGIHDQIR